MSPCASAPAPIAIVPMSSRPGIDWPVSFSACAFVPIAMLEVRQRLRAGADCSAAVARRFRIRAERGADAPLHRRVIAVGRAALAVRIGVVADRGAVQQRARAEGRVVERPRAGIAAGAGIGVLARRIADLRRGVGRHAAHRRAHRQRHQPELRPRRARSARSRGTTGNARRRRDDLRRRTLAIRPGKFRNRNQLASHPTPNHIVDFVHSISPVNSIRTGRQQGHFRVRSPRDGAAEYEIMHCD